MKRFRITDRQLRRARALMREWAFLLLTFPFWLVGLLVGLLIVGWRLLLRALVFMLGAGLAGFEAIAGRAEE